MSVNSFAELLEHVGHDIAIAVYGRTDGPWNVAVECRDCGAVLLDYDAPEATND